MVNGLTSEVRTRSHFSDLRTNQAPTRTAIRVCVDFGSTTKGFGRNGYLSPKELRSFRTSISPVHLLTPKYAPIWLPLAFLLRDVGAWIYVFSYEPGITDKAVRIHHFLLIPGVFFDVEWSTFFNLVFAVVLGFALRIAATRHFPLMFSLLVLTWNLVLVGILGFFGEENGTLRRLFRIGMLPGRYLSHLLANWNFVSNWNVLLATTLVTNFLAATALTAVYLRVSHSDRKPRM